jgi:hypothetical protein
MIASKGQKGKENLGEACWDRAVGTGNFEGPWQDSRDRKKTAKT